LAALKLVNTCNCRVFSSNLSSFKYNWVCQLRVLAT